MNREEWLERFAAHMSAVSKMDRPTADKEAVIYLDEVLDGDVTDDPTQAAQDAMEDWQ